MCTVTFIPARNRVYFTSNRDERAQRPPALAPAGYLFPSGNIFFPKDTLAGGTWFAVHENGNVLVLLNGGFTPHVPISLYRKSRGLVLLEMADHETPFNFFRAISLDGIEPFTVVIWEYDNLFECRWDGEKKHARHLDKSIPHIWSSATLYNQQVSEKRATWFENWLGNREVTASSVIGFHQFAGDGDSHNDITMNRDGNVFTVSITSVAISDQHADLTYIDLLDNKTYLQGIELKKELAARP